MNAPVRAGLSDLVLVRGPRRPCLSDTLRAFEWRSTARSTLSAARVRACLRQARTEVGHEPGRCEPLRTNRRGHGHNGLVNACYLARAGLKVLVLERNPYIAGSVQPPLLRRFTYSNCSYVCSLPAHGDHPPRTSYAPPPPPPPPLPPPPPHPPHLPSPLSPPPPGCRPHGLQSIPTRLAAP